MRLVLASNNRAKLAELAALFSALPIELVAQGELGVAEAEEPHVTFVENALAKARHAARAANAAAIADDSGLCVDALGGAPGVQSAHYAPVKRRVTDREGHRRVQDAACDTDINVVMTASGGFVELQGTAEGATFSRAEMDALLGLAGKGIAELVAAQRRALAASLPVAA